jgi:nicotinamide riboside transporter PnuC
MRSFMFQIGQFFLVIGVILLAVFFVTGESNDPQYLYFFGGVLITAFGVYLMHRNRSQSGESARFRAIRRQRQKARERREKKRQELQERRER